ncbi:MAG: thiamine diphosphokinase [Clostridia bacterium]|nr:thiamine diphosphokinase [Clostridia bacterium]
MRCVIVGGADIRDYDSIRDQLRPDDYVVYCDSGLRHMERLHASPSLIVGDFDSYEKPETDVETIVLPREKDDTDTMFAVREALRRGCDRFLLIGVIGARLDHTLGNVSILLFLDSIGIPAAIIDDYSEMEIVSRQEAAIGGDYAYFSLLNISGTAFGINISGAKYPLENAEITCEYQYGISNEVLPGHTARVSVKTGRLLLIKVRRES